MGYLAVLLVALYLMSQPDKPMSHANETKLAQAATSMGIGSPWLLWLLWTAQGESGGSIAAWNDSPGERAAAGKAFDRLVAQGRWPCPETRDVYAIGSGGWFGQLAPYTVLFGHELGYGCDPHAIWRDPVASIRVHLRQVRGTLAILRSKTGGGGTFLQLRALYGLPSRDPQLVDTPERRAQYTKTLRRAGLDPALLDQVVPPLPEVFS